MKKQLIIIFIMISMSNFLGADYLSTISNWTQKTSSIDHSVSYQHPINDQVWSSHGFRIKHDGSLNVLQAEGLEVELSSEYDLDFVLTTLMSIPPQPARIDYLPSTSCRVTLKGRGPHRIYLPWTMFDFQQAQPAFLNFINQIHFSAKTAQHQKSLPITINKIQLSRGKTISFRTQVNSKPLTKGGIVIYESTLSNESDKQQSIILHQEKYGWESMTTEIAPSHVSLEPGASIPVTIRISLEDILPAGVQEKQTIVAIANGDGYTAKRLEFLTMSKMPHPYIVHTPERWLEVKNKIKNHDWAKKEYEKKLSKSNKWKVPPLAKKSVKTDHYGLHLFKTHVEKDLMAAGISYQISGNISHAKKVHEFMLRLSDPNVGYPKTKRGCHQSLVQEGHFFQHIAMAYDMVLPSGLFTKADRDQIEKTFRIFIETIDFETQLGAINNWNLSEICGALYCSLVMQDMNLVNRFFRGANGILDQMGKGVMSDGWWYECAISYNVWCSTEFSQVALALEPFGIRFKDMPVPISTVPNFSIIPWAYSNQYGMSFEKWGPITSPTVHIKKMWDALPPFIDYRGVMFGVNDATERSLGSEGYELAYYLYRDPKYASIIKQSGKRDLLYGVPDLPENTPEIFKDNAHADNVGLVMLRSQTPERPIREQIQAVLHYGTHGGYHGHFDRTGLIHLSRYGRSFYNPEMVWYSYAPFMYKYYVQNSTSKNMVVVDRKMQEPVESKRNLFYSGNLIQVTAVETKARWSTPPYGGMVYPEQGHKSLADKAFHEGRSLPSPTPEPEYGSVTEYTEPILQRRLMVVTDDYVLLADHLKGEKEHTFENCLQMKGFKGIHGDQLVHEKHEEQWDTNPILDAQFVTDVDWYSGQAPLKAEFEMKWGEGADNKGTRAPESEDGVLKLDVHSLWPLNQMLMVGTAPECHNVAKRVYWTVKGDENILAEGKFGAWILGKEDIYVKLNNVMNLKLETRVEKSRNPTLFWANARVVLEDGREVPITEFPMNSNNIHFSKGENQDYFGGPIKIVGTQYSKALSAQPKNENETGTIQVDLSNVDAVAFKVILGGDYPLGDESQRRKTYGSQVKGKEARFLTIIEPHEDKSVILHAEAIDINTIRVSLKNGKTQTIRISNLDGSGENIKVDITQILADGTTIRETSE